LQSPESKTDELLRTAIDHKRLVRLLFKNKHPIIEPHDYGVLNGSVKLFVYQVGGSSSGKLPNWRLMEADEISDVHCSNGLFPAAVPSPLANTTSGTSSL